MKFSIRDLLWLTVMAALAVSWWLDHRRQAQTIERFSSYRVGRKPVYLVPRLNPQATPAEPAQ